MTKALQLARSFNAEGHRVVLVESGDYWMTAHRFARSVATFHTVPAPDAPNYADTLLTIAKQENVDVFVPVSSPVGSFYDAKAAKVLEVQCKTMHVAPEVIDALDNKHEFALAAARMELASPHSVLITDPAQVLSYDFGKAQRPYILKSIAYDPVRRLDLTRLPLASADETAAYIGTLPISKDNPWVMQEFITGTEYCTHGTFRDGRLTMHACCLSSPFQINYEHLDEPDIVHWVQTFGKRLNLTGQASFDFIKADDDGRFYAIECNPRTHSAITMFYDQPQLANAYLNPNFDGDPVEPSPSSKPTYWLYHELWRLLRAFPSLSAMRARMNVIFNGKDAVFDRRDPLPFLMLHHWHIPLLLLRNLFAGRDWLRIDFNIGKLVQVGGD